MTMSTGLLAVRLMAAGLKAGVVHAQTWNAEQTAALEAAAATWERDFNRDSGWLTRPNGSTAGHGS